MDTLIIFAAKYLIIVPVLILAWQFWRESRVRGIQFAVITLASFALAFILARTASHLYFDPRPFVVDGIAPLIPHVADNAFPSDHALFAAAIAAVGTLFSVSTGAVLWVLAIIIGSARVLAHVHHPIDIIGSFAIAALSTWIIATVWQRFK